MESENPWFLLLEVIFQDKKDAQGQIVEGPKIRLVRNTDDVDYQGETYTAFNFDLEMQQETSSGELPSVNLRVSNVSRILEGLLSQYEGGVGALVNLHVLNTSNLEGDPELSTQFTVVNSAADADFISFSLGADSPMRKNFPKFIYLANHCRFVYNSPALAGAKSPLGKMCGYLPAGGEHMPTCDKTFDGINGCKAHGNQKRFGGFPNLDGAGIRGGF